MTTAGLAARGTASCLGPRSYRRGAWGETVAVTNVFSPAAAASARGAGPRASSLFLSATNRTATSSAAAAATGGRRKSYRKGAFALRASFSSATGEDHAGSPPWSSSTSSTAATADGVAKLSPSSLPSSSSMSAMDARRERGQRLRTSLASGRDHPAAGGEVESEQTAPQYSKGGWTKSGPSPGAARWARWVDAPPPAPKNYGKGTFEKSDPHHGVATDIGYSAPELSTPPPQDGTSPAAAANAPSPVAPAGVRAAEPSADRSGSGSRAARAPSTSPTITTPATVAAMTAAGQGKKQSAWAAAMSKKKARLSRRVSCAEWMSRRPKEMSPRTPSKPVTLSKWMSARPTKPTN